jgi:hypothetical protein
MACKLKKDGLHHNKLIGKGYHEQKYNTILQQMNDAREEMKDPFFLLPTYGEEGRQHNHLQQHSWHCHLKEAFFTIFSRRCTGPKSNMLCFRVIQK